MTYTAALATLFVLTAVVARADDPDAKKAQQSLQGEWKVVSATKATEPLPKNVLEMARKATIKIDGNKLTTREGDGTSEETETFTLDSKAKPAAIDITKANGRVAKGVWKLEKDRLTLCFGLDGNERPKDVTPAKTNGTLVLERVKK